MLASALDAHPEVSCDGSRPNDWLVGSQNKILHGKIRMAKRENPFLEAQKVIFLYRDSTAVCKSIWNMDNNERHFMTKKTKTQREPPPSSGPAFFDDLAAIMKTFENLGPTLVLTYEGLTKDKDIKKFSKSDNDAITGFLGISNLTLIPRNFKPDYV